MFYKNVILLYILKIVTKLKNKLKKYLKLVIIERIFIKLFCFYCEEKQIALDKKAVSEILFGKFVVILPKDKYNKNKNYILNIKMTF